jgi:phosphohistidine phosphatase
MRLLFVRHGLAEDRDTAESGGTPDEYRALTAEGQKRLKKVAKALRANLEDLSLIATSPLLRAVQTAEILATEFDNPPLVETETLRPGSAPSTLLDWLREQGNGNAIALVGHEPDLGLWISWACAGVRDSFVPLRKGGACLVEFDEELRPGSAVLQWVLTPKQLRRLASK